MSSSINSIRLISSETRDLTPQLATEFSQMPASVTERDLDQRRCKFLRETILHGVALPFQWARATVLTDGVKYRVNGHHSSSVLAEMDGDMPSGLMVHIDDFEVADVTALPRLFRQFDNRRSSRSLDDISGAYQMVEPNLRSISRKSGKRAVDGLAWHERRIFGGSTASGEDAYVLFHDARYHPFILFAGPLLTPKTPEFTYPVVGAMFATYEKAGEGLSDEFWTAVSRQGGGFDEKHPATVLDAWLMAAREKDKRDKPHAMEVFRACIVAWNAFRSHRPLDRIGRFDPKKGWPEVE
jgi:hypothetical protein